MNQPLDVMFVSPDYSFQAYQALSKDFSAIKPPTWALLLAQSCRAKGFVAANDQKLGHLEAEMLRQSQALQRQAVEHGAQAKADATPPHSPVRE